MRRLRFLILGVASVAYAPAAHAYIDPGTGSLILQGIVGIFGAAAVTIGLYWTKVRNFFRRNDTPTDQEPKDDC